MNAEFYDMKAKAKVTTKVTEKVTYGEGTKTRYAFRAKTQDGRNLTKFVSEKDFKAAKI